MSNPDETNDAARIVADEQAKARRVLDADELYLIGTPDDMAIGGNMAKLEPPTDEQYDLEIRVSMSDAEYVAIGAEMKRLRADNAALREIAQAVADMKAVQVVDAGDYVLPVSCYFCGGPEGVLFMLKHTPDCIVTQARALLADT